MSGVAKFIGKVAGVAGTVAMFVAPQIGTALLAIAAVSNSVAQLTAKPPPAKGSVTDTVIGANMPMPYLMGRTYSGGHLVHDVGYGRTSRDVPNPYRTRVYLFTTAGPVDGIEAFQADFATVGLQASGEASGYYDNFLWVRTQRGLCPEPAALTPPVGGAVPRWGASHKLSGYAAASVTTRFDKDGKKFASGLPPFGVVGRWVRAYDPRLDSTYPGGSGPQRWNDEATWTWTENAALHALTYARGRYQNGRKVIGIGLAIGSIVLAPFVAWANVCDANAWAVGGAIYEPGSRWDNLKRICEAGGAEPIWVGGRLTVRFAAPRVALDRLTGDDLAEGPITTKGMQGWREQLNGIVPRYRSEAHRWEYVQSDLVSVAAYVQADGEEKTEERQFDLVQKKDQAAQLAAYKLVDARENGPITVPCKPRMLLYRPGEAISVHLPEAGLVERLCVIIGRRVDPLTAAVELTLVTEDTAKHAFALGRTGTAPPVPVLDAPDDLDTEAVKGVPRTWRQVTDPSTDPANLPMRRDVDRWVDISTAPQVEKMWMGADPGGWQVVANHVTTGPHIGVEAGADVTPDLRGGTSVDVHADHTGALQTPMPVRIRLRAMKGNTDVSPSVAWTASFPPSMQGGINDVAGSDRGVLTITGVSGGGQIQIAAGTQPEVQHRIAVNYHRASAPATGGGGGGAAATSYTDYDWAIAGGVATEVAGDGASIAANAAGQIRFSAYSEYSLPYGQGSASGRLAVRAQVQVGGAWVDVSAEVMGSAAVRTSTTREGEIREVPIQIEDNENYAGSVSYAEVAYGGLTPGSAYPVRLLARAIGDVVSPFNSDFTARQ